MPSRKIQKMPRKMTREGGNFLDIQLIIFQVCLELFDLKDFFWGFVLGLHFLFQYTIICQWFLTQNKNTVFKLRPELFQHADKKSPPKNSPTPSEKCYNRFTTPIMLSNEFQWFDIEPKTRDKRSTQLAWFKLFFGQQNRQLSFNKLGICSVYPAKSVSGKG